jgi:PIN domain nuclease of toxin-antitoxin system
VLRDQRQNNGLIIESVTLDDILGLSALPPHHRDPFDRLLVVQAQQRGFHLVTNDPEIARFSVSIIR